MDEYVCDVRQLAHYVVHKCSSDEQSVSNLQLQKMLYFLQTVYSKSGNGLLFKDEFEAWPYGPVMRDVYREYSSYGGCSIYKKYPGIEKLDFKGQKRFIDDGIEYLREKYPWDLVKIAHAKNSPWDLIYRDGRGYKEPIPNNLILESSAK